MNKLALLARLVAEGKGDRVVAREMSEQLGEDVTRHWVRAKTLELMKQKQATGRAVALVEPRTASEFAERINACWRRSVEDWFEIGRLLNAAKAGLEHGEFTGMIEQQLPFGPRTAQMFMRISADKRLANPKHASLLPADWTAVHELTKLDDAALEARFADGTITPDVSRATITAVVKTARLAPQREAYDAQIANGCTVDDLHALAATGFKAGVILADPPWKFMARSPLGEGRSASVHYNTRGIEEICALPIKQLAADDSVLIPWVVDWDADYEMARKIISAWGFEHKTTAFTWVKQNASGEGFFMGQGYWTRANPETAWFCTRGNPKRLNADVRQLIVAPVGEHSEKPAEVHERIERLVAGPYLELFGRVPVPNWRVWGDQIPRNVWMGEMAEAAE